MYYLTPNDYLQTPEYIYKEFGEIDLDPCANEFSTIGKINYALERNEDGIKLPWKGFVFCNPPFSKKELWMSKIINHNNGILLLPDRSSAPWYGSLATKADRVFIMGKKINFIGGTSSNNLGTALFLFGKEAVKRIKNCTLPGHLINIEVYRPRN